MDSVSPSKKALHNSPIGTFQKSNLIQTIETEDKLNLEKDNNNINDQEIKASSPSSLVPPSLKSSLNETEHKPLLHSLENSTDDLSNSSDDLVSHSSSRAVEFNLPEPLISRGWDVATEVTFVKPPMNTIDFEPLIPLSLKTRSTSSIMMNAESLYNTIRVPEPFQEEIQKEAISNNGFWGPDVPGTNAEFNEDKSFFIKDEFPAPNNHISHDYWEPPPAPTVNAEKASLYLNTVKARFSKSPAYYYSFLDIMKDYGSKSISTLEVVARVTELFESHPDLIEEFHSFLPPNLQNMYKNYAEIPESPCLSPSLPEEQAEKANETFSPHENCVEKPFSSGYVSLYTTPSPASPSKLPESPSNSAHGPASNGAEDMTTAAVARVEPVDPVKQALYNNPHDDVRKFAAFEASVHEAAHLHGIFLSGAATPRKPEVFHAFNYVTKIRERFSNQTETYKKFLDVLTTFKREKKTIEEVYRQVSLLFRDHPDLLEEFSQFLPERAGELSIYSAHPSPPPLPPHHHHYYHHHHHHHFHPRGFHPPQPRAHPLFVNRPYPSHHHTPSSNTTPSEVSRGAPYHSLPSISPPGHADQTDSPHARLPLRAPSFDQPDASPSSESRLWQMHEARARRQESAAILLTFIFN
ncbi:hypothetical protein Zmor_027117 [Zophobas morio]|uniref:Paired amphipathic helix protein Sin3a n=1 Tax=Zophobas morio TaxID=2755281 RepID=A0AA38LZL7_9CUCU|nr:hypothetical protein Zmor_027117 [Zophobas morio]